MTIENHIRSCIEQQLDNNKTKFIIFPFGDIGTRFDGILKMCMEYMLIIL